MMQRFTLATTPWSHDDISTVDLRSVSLECSPGYLMCLDTTHICAMPRAMASPFVVIKTTSS